MKTSLCVSVAVFFIGINAIFSQEQLDYLGLITLNDSSFISYRLNLKISDNKVSGYSITDFGGDHETKSLVKGEYDKNADDLAFSESEIIYTKSTYEEEDFCFVHFTGKINGKNKKKLSGKFTGLYQNNQKCIDGSIDLTNMETIMRKAQSMANKIERSNRVPDSIKKDLNLVNTLTQLTQSKLTASQNLTVASSQNEITLHIFDAGKVDGDIIDLWLNDDKILSDYAVVKSPKKIIIPFLENITIKIVAVNEGTARPNTALVELFDGVQKIQTTTDLATNESAFITLIKKQ